MLMYLQIFLEKYEETGDFLGLINYANKSGPEFALCSTYFYNVNISKSSIFPNNSKCETG